MLRSTARQLQHLCKQRLVVQPRQFSRLAVAPAVRPRVPHASQLIATRLKSTADEKTASVQGEPPQLMIAFTCKKCDTRSSHTFSKQAYHKGSVLIQCPGCKNRHLIADNLGVFRDNKVSVEDLLKAQGESVSTSHNDLVFEDIPESLRDTLGHYAKDAPEKYKKKEVENGLLEEKK